MTLAPTPRPPPKRSLTLTLGAASGGDEAALDERLGVDVDRREVGSDRFGLVAHLVRLVDLGGNVVGIAGLEFFDERLGDRDVQRRLVPDAFVGATRTSERVSRMRETSRGNPEHCAQQRTAARRLRPPSAEVRPGARAPPCP